MRFEVKTSAVEQITLFQLNSVCRKNVSLNNSLMGFILIDD